MALVAAVGLLLQSALLAYLGCRPHVPAGSDAHELHRHAHEAAAERTGHHHSHHGKAPHAGLCCILTCCGPAPATGPMPSVLAVVNPTASGIAAYDDYASGAPGTARFLPVGARAPPSNG